MIDRGLGRGNAHMCPGGVSGRTGGTAAEEAAEARDGVDVARDRAFLEGDDRVVRDLDVLGAGGLAAGRDVAVAQALALPQELAAVVRVERMHLELRVAD